MAQHRALEAFSEMWSVRESLFQLSQAIIHQIESDVRLRLVTRLRFLRPLCQSDDASGNHEFIRLSSLADAFDDVAITVTRRKVHPRIDARRVFAEQSVYETDALKEISPVERREQAHAGDDVPDRDLRGGLSLVLYVYELLYAFVLLQEVLFEPIHRGGDRRVLLAEPQGKLRDKSFAEIFSFTQSLCKELQQVSGLPSGPLQDPV